MHFIFRVVERRWEGAKKGLPKYVDTMVIRDRCYSQLAVAIAASDVPSVDGIFLWRDCESIIVQLDRYAL